MSETVGVIETRSRSRSKTPGLLFHENGDTNEKKGAKKIPTVSLIEEEDTESASQPSQRPKRQRRSAKNAQSDTSNEVSSEAILSNSSKQSKVITSTTTKVLTTMQIINGSEEKSSEQVSAKTVTMTTINNDAQDVPESQSIFNNIFNAIKTSTPILSSKRTKRVATKEISPSEIDLKDHPAYKEYKESGEYWNKYPKTDYTYSELSPHRRELGAGVVAMPNMSRRSLDKYTNRVETMIQQNPTEESFIRRKFLSNMSYQKKAMDLQYDSSDEVDVSMLHQKLSARRYSRENLFSRFYLYVVGVISSAYYNIKQKIGFNSKYYSSYTPIKRHQQQGLIQRMYNFTQRFILLCISKVYLFISTILSLDTWFLYTRSENVQENRKRKRFLLGLLALLPLLLFGVLLLSNDNTNDTSAHVSRININPLVHIHRVKQSISQYFSNITRLPPKLPQLSLDFGWMLAPFTSVRTILHSFIYRSNTKAESLRLMLNEDKFQLLLKHIDNYVDSIIDDKLNAVNSAFAKDVNERMVVMVGNHIKYALKEYDNEISSKDVELVINRIKVQLQNDFNEKEKIMLGKIALANEENVKKIIANIEQNQNVKLENQKIDLDKIIVLILESKQISSFFDEHLKIINQQLSMHDADIQNLKKAMGEIKLEVMDKFTIYDEEFKSLRFQDKSFSDDLMQFKKENDEAIKDILQKMDEKYAILSKYPSIDTSVRKALTNILGLNIEDSMDETYLKQWIDNTFVAKVYLEEHLRNIELKLNENFSKALIKNAGVLMEEINKRLEIKLNHESKSEKNVNAVGGLLSEEDVRRIVKEILAIYDADKTGLVDYALESAGAEILSTRCTENYRTRSAEISILGIPIWYPSNTPRTVIAPAINPGECWAFQGFPGYLVIKLNNFIQVTGFTIEHIPQMNAPNGNIDSAPNKFTVWGLTSEFDKNPVLFGTYFYSAEKDAPGLQYFPVMNKEILHPYQIVELVIESNHGNPKYTCLYRFRVHGEIN